MKKHILIAATAALLALPNLSSTVLAASPDASEDAGAQHPKFSADDFAAFTDARIAALKVGVLTVNSIRLAQSRESRDALRSWETFSN